MRSKFSASAMLLVATALVVKPLYADTLADIYDLAVQNDPQIAAAQAVYKSRAEVVNQARAGLLPSIGLGGSTSDNRRRIPLPNTTIDQDPTSPTFGETIILSAPIPTNRFNSHGWQASLTQPVFRLDRWFQFGQSKNIKAQARAQFASEQQNLIVRVAETYLAILEAQDSLAAANAERDAVQRQLEQVQQRFDVGLVAITDVLEATAAFDSSTVGVIEAEGRQTTSFEPLLRLTGRHFKEVSAVADDFPIKYPEPNDEESWVDAALQQNYSLVASREAVNAARREVQIARAGRLPTIDAQVAWQHQVTGGGDFFGSKVDNRLLQLQMSMPIYTGGATTSVVKQSVYQLEEAQKNLDLTQRTVVENTRTLFSAINTDVARVRARLRGIESSQSALDATQTGYEVGTRNIVDVLQAQRQLYLSQFQYASARYQYILDTLRLKQIVGSLSPDDIYEISEFVDTEEQVGRITPTTR